MEEGIANELIKQIGEDKELQVIIIDWINKIESNNVKVITRSDNKGSSYYDGVIRISCKETSPKGINVLWDLLHEYGHHLDADTSQKESTPRELRAWNIAKDLLRDEDIYSNNINGFNHHMNSCLQSYRIGDLLEYARKECTIVFIDNSEVTGVFQTFNKETLYFRLKSKEQYTDHPFNEIKEVKGLANK